MSVASEQVSESSDEKSDDVLSDNNPYLLNPNGRLDYSLQEGVIENSYLAALAAHVNYWGDQDVAAFMLQDFYKSRKQ